MTKISKYLMALAFGALATVPAFSQKSEKKPKTTETAPVDNSGSGNKSARVTREVNGCEYDVLSGLAEVISIDKVVEAARSPLAYDEYEVKFRFIPMVEGQQLMASLRETEFTLTLKHKQYQLRVGPEYLKAYHVRIGLKYAMKLLQDRNGQCGQPYMYESGGLPNDLFEAREHLADFESDYYAKKLGAKEEVIEQENFNNSTNPNNVPDGANPDPLPGRESATKRDLDPAKSNTTTNPNPTTNTTVVPAVVSGNPDENTNPDNTTTTTTTATTTTAPVESGTVPASDEEAMRLQIQKELEEQIRKELEAERIKKAQEEEAARKLREEEERKNAIKNAKAKAKEDELKKKEEEERLRLEAEARKAKEEALKAQIRAELETKLRTELQQKELEAQQLKADEERKKLEEEKQAQAALAREEAVRKARETEAQRAACVFSDKVSGVIEVLETKKVKEATESVFGYAEYEVLVRFMPDNFDDIPKKDRAVWEKNHIFVLDAKGKSANPGARYIRQFNVFKGAKYKGFAQQMQSGVCSELMMFSPDLPADASQVKP